MLGRLTIAFAGIALVLALPTFGQVALPFYDGFETGTLMPGDSPPGLWNSVIVATGNSLLVSDAGAHSGTFGLRVVDTSTSDAIQPAQLHRSFQRGAGPRYLRQWVRVTSTADAGNLILGMLWDGVQGRNICQITLSYPGPEISVYGEHASGASVNVLTGVNLPLGSWHLVECGVLDGGTASTTLVLWLDGIELGRSAGMNQSGCMADAVDTGESVCTSDCRFVGVIDTDDVAVTSESPASRLRLDAGTGPFAADACIPVEVSLFSSQGPAASAVRSEPLAFSSTGPAASFFADPACTTSAAVAIGVGQPGTVVGLRSGVGTLNVSVTSVDLLGDSTALSIGPGGPVVYNVSCDCSTGAGPSALALLGLCAARSIRGGHSRRSALLSMVRRRGV